MTIKSLNHKLRKNMWIYEREDGDKGIVLAATYEEAKTKLAEVYTDAIERIEATETADGRNIPRWMYLFDVTGIEIKGNVFITTPW